MDKYQGIFDQGFSGILDENKNKMPDYLEKLADQEKDYKPEYLETPNILFNKDSGLSRANELTSDGSRDSNRTNRFTIEKNQREAQQNKPCEIDKLVESMKNQSFDKIRTSLLSKYPNDFVNKYFESKIKLILNKFAYLGFENINEKQANIVEQLKTNFRIKRSTVHDILDKFSKLEYVSNNVTKQYKDLLGSKRPLYIVAKFLFSLDSIKKSFYSNKEDNLTFKRDVDKKISNLRDIDNNSKKNSDIARQSIFASMLNTYKQCVNSRMSRSQINQKMARSFGLEKLQEFHSIFKNDIIRIERFSNRQTFDTDFASAVQQGYEIQPKSKPVDIDSKAMLNYAFEQMTNGCDLESIHTSLKKKFGREAAIQFLSENDYKLSKHYGQLGYLFVDSNIYANCDEMVNSFSKLQHTGSKLIYSVKANSKCVGCTLHKEGHCEKTGLLVSNNPVVRSARAAKRVFDKAYSFVPKNYVESFVSQIKKEDSNLELVSKFALGISAVIESEKKNIGKQASKDRTESTDVQEGFISAESYSVDLFNEQGGSSRIIDDILKEGKYVSAKDIKIADIENLISNLSFFLTLNQVHLDSYANKLPNSSEEVKKVVKWAVSNGASIVKLRNDYESKKRKDPTEAISYLQRNVSAILKFTHDVLSYAKPVLEKYLDQKNIPTTLPVIEKLYRQISSSKNYDILKEASGFRKKIESWDVVVDTHITKGADPTQVIIVKLKKGNEEIKLTEFQGIVTIDWNAEKKENIPKHITVSTFAGADNTKDLDKLLSSIGAPTWTQIEKEYEKHQESLSDY